jgi:hypothetical protein
LSNNTASDAPDSAAGIGGAILNLGTLVLNNSTLSGNYARNDGGAINSQGSSAAVVINHSTIVLNDSDDFIGGIYFSGGSATLNNSIVAGNTANTGSDITTGLASTLLGVNFVGNITNLDSFRPGTDLTFEDGQALADLFVPTLANNGGPTLTHALVAGSPAVDAGDNSTIPVGMTTDQRGKTRIIEGTADLGAFEAGPSTLFVHQHAGDFTLTNDQGNPGLDAGDTVTWNGSSLGAPVPDLIFGTDAFLSVIEAIAYARENATVRIAAGTYLEGAQINIAKNLTLRGDGASLTALSGNGLHRVMQITGAQTQVSLHDLAVTNGYIERRTRVTFYGAGIDNQNADLRLMNVRVAGNRLNAPSNDGAFPQGAGVANQNGSVEMAGCVFENNVINSIFSASVSGRGRGGAIYNAGTLSIRNSLFDSNRMTDIGLHSQDSGWAYGAAIFHQSGSASVTNTTFTNHAVDVRDGFGETIYSVAGFTGNHLTIAGASTRTAASIERENGTFILNNSIVVRDAQTTRANEMVGTITSQNNLIGLSGNAASLAEVLGTIADNGGPTRTHAIVPGSPALNAGNNALIPVGLTTDQRGYPRILDGTVDIGAVEFTPAFVLPARTLAMDPGLSGKIRISELLASITGGGGLPLTLVSFTQPGHPGSVVRVSGAFLVYQSAPGQTLADSFTYTVTDGIQTLTGIITIELDGVGDGPTFNITSLEVANGTATIRVAGIPGVVYQIESSETMAPSSWSVLGNVQVCPPGGIMTFTDPGPLPAGRFYRAVRADMND